MVKHEVCTKHITLLTFNLRLYYLLCESHEIRMFLVYVSFSTDIKVAASPICEHPEAALFIIEDFNVC